MSGADGMVLAEWAFFANPVGCRSAGSGAAQAGREAAAEPGASPFGVGMLQVIEDGQGVPAQAVVRVAHGVPGPGLVDRVAVLAAEAERLRAAAQGFLVVAHLCGEPADRVESPGDRKSTRLN